MNPELRREDECLFDDRRRGRALGQHRSLNRADVLWQQMGLTSSIRQSLQPRLITVVGSKGKGTAASYAAATLAAAGVRVGLLTSPGLRSNRERIRVGGHAIGAEAYSALVRSVAAAIRQLGPVLPDDGYLSPTGLFTLIALIHFQATGCEALVLEAGMGGRSDEVSLLEPAVVAVTPIFDEHLGILGNTVEEIAQDKLGVVSANTVAISSVRQYEPSVSRVIAQAAQGRLLRIAGDDGDASWPAAPIGANAQCGHRAGRLLLQSLHREGATPERLQALLESVTLPGRQSLHRLGPQTVLLDAAVNGKAALLARRRCEQVAGPPAAAVLCLPDGKPRHREMLAALEGIPVHPVRLDQPHLAFDQWQRPLARLRDIPLTSLGSPLLCLGTVSFVGEMLDILGVDTETLWDANGTGVPTLPAG